MENAVVVEQNATVQVNIQEQIMELMMLPLQKIKFVNGGLDGQMPILALLQVPV
jgi:hypothetical protein